MDTWAEEIARERARRAEEVLARDTDQRDDGRRRLGKGDWHD